MKKQTTLALFICFMPLLASAFGGFSGNGADYSRDQNNPWFLGTQPVTYCLRSSATYPLPPAELRQLVEESIGEWRGFFKKYGFDQNTIGDSRYPRRFPDGVSRAVSIDFRQVPDCSSQSVDLEILFGIKNDPVNSTIEHGGHHGAGLAVRTEMDAKTFRSSGFIWVDDFSSDRARVKHMFLHELGHVLGMKHNSVHVMDENIADWLTDNPKYSPRFVGKIESDYWKYSLTSGETVQLFVSPRALIRTADPDGYIASKDLPAVLRELLGMKTASEYRVVLAFGRYSDPGKQFFLKLEISERGGHEKRTLDVPMSLSSDQRENQWASGYYTKWLREDGVTEFAEVLFEPADILKARARRLNGSLFTPTGKNLGCVLDFERGVSLKIFEPTRMQWFELQ